MPSETSGSSARTRPDDQLRAAALAQFATAGFAGTSLQKIADEAGFSKSSVLYHFASKEALLDAVLEPAIEELEGVIEEWSSAEVSDAATRTFLEAFVDFLLRNRREVHIFINQGQSLPDVSVVQHANAVIAKLSDAVCPPGTGVEDKLRFGMALGGAAYTLTADLTFGGEHLAADDELRPALIRLITELLAPVPARTVRR